MTFSRPWTAADRAAIQGRTLAEIERVAYELAMHDSHGSKRGAARRLGIAHSTFADRWHLFTETEKTKRTAPLGRRLTGLRDKADAILLEEAKRWQVSPELVRSRNRHDSVINVRGRVAARLRSELFLSYPAIGRVLGGRNHATVLNLLRRRAARFAEFVRA